MKNIITILSLVFVFISCEDVIEVDLDTSNPRLVIEASINLLEDGSTASVIHLTKTAAFFDNVIPIVDDAIVKITSEDSEEFTFNHIGNGDYHTNFTPDPMLQYTLTVIENGQTYTATEQLNTVSSIENVEQNEEGGFNGDEIEIRFSFLDPPGIENYYYVEGLSTRGNNRDAFNDEFFDGNEVPGFYFVEDLTEGDVVTLNLFGVDEQFYNFMFVLLQQGSEDSGGPFETQPATIKGNIINQTDPDNYPLGYFRISELSTVTFTIQ